MKTVYGETNLSVFSGNNLTWVRMSSVRCPYMFVSKLTLNIVRPKADVLVHTITGVVLPFGSIQADRGALFQRPTEVLKPHSAREP